MQTTITKEFRFEAAHRLINHQGKCFNLHGHSYRVEVTVGGEVIEVGPSEGMVIDFAELSNIVKIEVIDKFDHKYLNDLLDFPPTAELIAAEIFGRLKRSGLNIYKVRLWETPTSYVTISK